MAARGVISGNLLVFDGTSYGDWCVKMEAILGFQEVDDIVKKGLQEPAKNATYETKNAYKESRRLDCKARMLPHQCVSATVFQKISKATTSKEICDILQETYGNAGKIKAVKLQSLQRQYELLCMKDQESVADYLGRLQVLVNSMRACDEPVKNSKVVAKILRTLTPQYDHIVVAIEECKDLTTMSLEEL